MKMNQRTSLLLSMLGVLCLVAASPATVIINLDALSNTDWASPTTNPAYVNNAVVSVDGVVVGNRAGSPPAVGDGSNTATLDVSTFILDDVSQPAPLGYTVEGLDIDGIGGNNDSIVLMLSVSTDGQNIQTVSNATEPRNAGWLSSGGATLNADGEYIQFDFTSLVVNLNEGSNNGTGTFDGFTAVRIGGFGAGDIGLANGIVRSFDDGDLPLIDLTSGGPDSSLRMSFVDGTTSGTFRPDYFSLQVTAGAAVIPEPASLALLGLGCLSCLMIWRCRM